MSVRCEVCGDRWSGKLGPVQPWRIAKWRIQGATKEILAHRKCWFEGAEKIISGLRKP